MTAETAVPHQPRRYRTNVPKSFGDGALPT